MRLTPEEYQCICRCWQDMEEQSVRDDWERMRLLATITIQPHVIKRLSAKELLKFPWDGEKTGRTGNTGNSVRTYLSSAEQKKRFAELAERFGK